MKKLSLAWKKYINRVSVLITVFSVFMTASFYNPASLASDKGSRVPLSSVFTNTGIYIDGTPTWNFSFGDGVHPGSSASADVSRVMTSGAPIYSGDAPGSNPSLVDTNIPLDITVWSIDQALFYDNGAYIDGYLQMEISVSFTFSSNSGSFAITDKSTCNFAGINLPVSFFESSYKSTSKSNYVYTTHLRIYFNNVPVSYQSSFYNLHLDLNVQGYYSDSNMFSFLTLKCVAGDASGYMYAGFKGSPDTNILTDGYDASSGTASQSKLDSSLSGQEAKEDSLFTSASDNLSKFSLADLTAMPKVVAGLAFVSSTMTSIFEALGGVNGAGIVLSVGCSILFVSFCVGAYKFYSGRKD